MSPCIYCGVTDPESRIAALTAELEQAKAYAAKADEALLAEREQVVIESLDGATTALQRRVEELTAELERSRYKGCGSYPRAIGEIESRLGIVGNPPLGEVVEAVRKLVTDLAAERAAREMAEKEAAQYKLWWDETSKSHDATNAHLEQAEHEGDTAMARVKELEAALASAQATIARVCAVPLWSMCQAEPEPDDDEPLYTGMLTDPGGQWIRIDDLLEALSSAPERSDKRSRWNELGELPVTVMATSEHPSPAPCSGCAALSAAIDQAIRDMLSGGHPFEKGVAKAVNDLRAAQKDHSNGADLELTICASCGATL